MIQHDYNSIVILLSLYRTKYNIRYKVLEEYIYDIIIIIIIIYDDSDYYYIYLFSAIAEVDRGIFLIIATSPKYSPLLYSYESILHIQ
jgi:hypothetical protein